MSDLSDRGIQERYAVERIDGKADPEGCRYFVLRIDGDEVEREWVRAVSYKAREQGFDQLADDLFEMVPAEGSER
jgi:hypothetical protein